MAHPLNTGAPVPLVSAKSFKSSMWALCGLATLFLTSRFAVRMSTKGRLMMNDYFLVAALPMLFGAAALLHSVLDALYSFEDAAIDADHEVLFQPHSATVRLTAAFEMLWTAIYCVKFCFLAQFKFYKPPFAYAVLHLTRHFWASIGICAASFLFTIIQPVILCRKLGSCRYFDQSNTVSWEMAVTAIDIVTDLLVISIPALLIHMAQFTRSQTIINFTFKSLSVFAIAVAVTRLVLQYNEQAHRIQYVTLAFSLVVEAAVALIMASISSYRVVLLDHLAEHRMRKATAFIQPRNQRVWSAEGGTSERNDPYTHQDDSLAKLSVVEPARLALSPSNT